MLAKTAAAAALLAGLLLAMPLLGDQTPLPQPVPSSDDGSVQAERSYGQLPLAFEPSAGRGSGADYVAHTRAGAVGIDASGATLALGDGESARTLGLELIGAGAAEPTSLQRLPGVVNDLRSDQPERWRTGIPTFERVRYEGVYPGVDIDWYGNQRRLEYDLRVAPGADPEQIAFRLRGADEARLAGNGDLLIGTGETTIRQRAPVAYQPARAGVNDPVGVHFHLHGTTVSFRVDSYGTTRPLVIDPLVLAYSTYLGGTGGDGARGIAVDSSGAAYLGGETTSTDFDTKGPIEGDDTGPDAFVSKLNPAGNALVYSTYLGGTGQESARGIAVDSTGAAYVTGLTDSTDFPAVNQFELDDGGFDAFVSKLSPAGNALAYSTYFGGSSIDWAQGIDVGPGGAAYITGFTNSPDINVMNQFETYNGGGGLDAFVARFDTTAAGAGSLDYSTYLGSIDDSDLGQGIAADAGGNAYVTGVTASSSFDTVGPIEGNAPGDDAFVSKLNTNAVGAASLVYSTYLGGDGSDVGNAIDIDSSGSAYVTGSTGSTDFNTAGPIEGDTPGGLDAFVSKLNPAGSALAYSTYLGGSADDQGKGIAVDSAGAAHVAGTTESNNLDTADAVDTAGGGEDAFAFKLTPAGSALTWSTYLAGSGEDEGNGIAVDPSGAAYVGGHTDSGNFPTAGALEGPAGARDAFAAKLVVTGLCGKLRPTKVGTAGKDTIKGTKGKDVIIGLGGNDVIKGLGGNDVLCGKAGKDTIKGGGGRDRIKGGTGADRLEGGKAADKLKGGKGSDKLFGQGGNDRLFGQAGKDALNGGPGRDKQIP